MSTAYIYRDPTSSTSVQKATFSFWCKRNKLTTGQYIFFNGLQSDYGSYNFYIKWHSDDTIKIINDDNGVNFKIVTNRKFLDCNSWYHIYLALDLTESGADRGKLYINGVQETSFSSSTNMSGDQFLTGKNNYRSFINRSPNATSEMGGYCLSHCYYIDGYIVDVGQFGSTDSTTGEWKINTSPTIANYGTNGFLIFKDSNTITDQSSGSNNWLLAQGSLTKTEDCPSNVFCTLNPLQEPLPAQAVEYSFGNTKFAGNLGDWQRCYGTIGANTGKFFYEFKCLNTGGNSDHLRIGWDSIDNINSGTDSYFSGLTIDTAGKLRGGINGHNDYDPNAVQMTAISGGNFSFTTGDILGMAIDIDNNTFSVYKNGTLEINAYSYASASNCSLLKSKGHFIAPSVNFFSSSGNANRSCFNFGNGYFETTAVSSAGTNASGVGIFEYNVPANYTAFSTKGLNE